MPRPSGPERRSLADRLRRLLSSPEERESEDLRRLAHAQGARQISDWAPRDRVTIAGEVTAIGVSGDSGWLEAELTDNSGSVTLIWMGRSQLGAVKVGTMALVHGRMGLRNGKPIIFNPDYDVLS